MEAVPTPLGRRSGYLTTIAEVASRAGVGVGTVSRVLNRSPAVAAETRRRVLAVIDELGYEPNAAAQALSTGRTRTLGIVAPFFTQPSVVSRLRGVSDAISAAGYQLVIFDAARPAALAALPVLGRLDGLLCLSVCPSAAQLARLRSAGVAVALIDGEHPELTGVSIDDVEGGRMAVRHLVELGHRRIAFVGDPEGNEWGFVSSARRRRGAEAAAAEAGAELIGRRGPHDRRGARALAHGLPASRHARGPPRARAAALLASRRPPTAVFAPSDLQALGVLEAAETAGVDVPGEL